PLRQYQALLDVELAPCPPSRSLGNSPNWQEAVRRSGVVIVAGMRHFGNQGERPRPQALLAARPVRTWGASGSGPGAGWRSRPWALSRRDSVLPPRGRRA